MNHERLDPFHHAFASLAKILPGAELPWLRSARRRAFEQFGAFGVPGGDPEDWKYTNAALLGQRPWHFAPQGVSDEAAAARIADTLAPGAPRLVFVNGRHLPKLSRLDPLPHGVFIGSLARALREMPDRLASLFAAQDWPDGFAALNTAFASDGFVVVLPAGAVLEAPLQVLFIGDEADLSIQPFNAVLAGACSGCAIVEHYVGAGEAAYLTNAITHIVAGEHADVQHYRLQQEGRKAFHVAGVSAVQRHASRFASHSFAFGAALSRVAIGARLAAHDAEVTMNGLYFAAGRQHMDHHTRIDHLQPHGTSREYYRGVLGGAARGVFNGRVIVHPDAQRTDAHQANHTLLLSDHAEIDTKPQLEIFADDVRCTHGATVGQLDDEQLFYLRARGIDEVTSRAWLTYAFARDIVERVRIDALRERLDDLLFASVPEGGRVRTLRALQ